MIRSPFGITKNHAGINGGDVFSVPIDCQAPADSPAVYNEDGAEYNTGTITDEGRFLIKTNVELNAGDEIKVIASFGAKAPNLKGAVFPGVGELTLAPAGTEVPVGYDYTIPVVEEADPSDPLSGLTILWVGSSVTYGAQAGGHYSMVDAIQDNHAATICEKYAISATTLVNQSEESYVARLKLIPKDKTPDLIVVQLSTNDATTNKPFGEIAEGFEMDSFDDTTITGAIETISTTSICMTKSIPIVSDMSNGGHPCSKKTWLLFWHSNILISEFRNHTPQITAGYLFSQKPSSQIPSIIKKLV